MAADLVPVDLETLAERINAEHEQCAKAMRAGLHHALEAGRLLLEAKTGLPHGAWLPWLREHCTMPERTAQLYMRLARELPAQLEGDKSARLADLSISEAADLLARHREPEPLRIAAREVIPPESREPRRVAITSSPVEPTEPRHVVLRSMPVGPMGPLRELGFPPPDFSALRPVSLPEVTLPAPVREQDVSVKRVTSEGPVHEPACQGEVSAEGKGEGERTRVSGCGEAMQGARTLSEVAQRLHGLALQLLTLEREGWRLQAPMTGEADVRMVRD
jgi:Protein of unknown function (DUF3102)